LYSQRSVSTVSLAQVARGGGQRGPLEKRKKFNIVFHRQLEQNFPDWENRMNYQKNLEDL